ncbi:hypothetical protein [Streptomyces chryseus]
MQTFIDHARSLGERTAAHDEHRAWFGQLRPHGWSYAVDTGRVLAHDPAADTFLPL